MPNNKIHKFNLFDCLLYRITANESMSEGKKNAADIGVMATLLALNAGTLSMIISFKHSMTVFAAVLAVLTVILLKVYTENYWERYVQLITHYSKESEKAERTGRIVYRIYFLGSFVVFFLPQILINWLSQ